MHLWIFIGIFWWKILHSNGFQCIPTTYTLRRGTGSDFVIDETNMVEIRQCTNDCMADQCCQTTSLLGDGSCENLPLISEGGDMVKDVSIALFSNLKVGMSERKTFTMLL